MVTIEQADGKDPGVEGVNLLYDMGHGSPQTEASVKCFGYQSYLSVSAKVLIVLAEGTENRGSSREGSNDLVVSV